MTIADCVNSYKTPNSPDLGYKVTRNGRVFELEYLGYTIPDGQTLFFNEDQYISYEDSLEEVMDIQPEGFDPSNPSGGRNAEFFREIQDKMSPCLNPEELRMYISVGTRMDYFHGVDAFFLWKDEVVTIDLTVDVGKISKADICVRPEDVESGGGAFSFLAREIVLRLIRKRLYKLSSPRKV